jgi:hypothetical protein
MMKKSFDEWLASLGQLPFDHFYPANEAPKGIGEVFSPVRKRLQCDAAFEQAWKQRFGVVDAMTVEKYGWYLVRTRELKPAIEATKKFADRNSALRQRAEDITKGWRRRQSENVRLCLIYTGPDHWITQITDIKPLDHHRLQLMKSEYSTRGWFLYSGMTIYLEIGPPGSISFQRAAVTIDRDCVWSAATIVVLAEWIYAQQGLHVLLEADNYLSKRGGRMKETELRKLVRAARGV